MPVEELAMQYGVVGVALAFFYLLFKETIHTNAEAMKSLSQALDNLNESFRDLKEEIRLMRTEIDAMNRRQDFDFDRRWRSEK